jgi:hypothetical protein
VYRLTNRALQSGDDRSRLVICIDELDKVINFGDLRDFVRRIKGIFEIPGVFYYLSISEDALSALHLGSAYGKNEIDSSFDHILLLEPLRLNEGAQLAEKYLLHIGYSDLQTRLADCISVISAGVPRDVMRRCDELHSLPDEQITAASFLRHSLLIPQTYYKQVALSAELAESEDESGLPLKTDDPSFRLPEEPEIARLRCFLSVHHLLERSLQIEHEEAWSRIADELRNLCYRIPIAPPETLKRMIISSARAIKEALQEQRK